MIPRIRLNQSEYNLIIKNRNSDSRVLIIPDLHEPFCLSDFRPFCKSIYEKYGCNKVVFIGDIIDNHYSSYHESDPDGDSAGQELNEAIEAIKKWNADFPEAWVTIGNHDRIPDRRAYTAGLAGRWIKTIDEGLNTHGWIYGEQFVFNDVLYCHGENKQARARARDDVTSVVQGHWHTKGYIEYFVGRNIKMFAMQVGCGINIKAYSMAYAKHFKKPHICCAVVLENGKLPILEYMNL